MITYSLGFVFDLPGKLVALIEKQKPDWQKGKLNGIGGKDKEGETPVQSMQREFCEETGLDLHARCWINVAKMINNQTGWCVNIFTASLNNITHVRSMTEETVHILPVDCELIKEKAIPNLRWLIPMCQDANVRFAEVNYK
ncbi:MAG TPA: NUDIX domain-containing protein [Pirellula sp.]|nr:NUDIX domain-containing protein [Pirellula sp.]